MTRILGLFAAVLCLALGAAPPASAADLPATAIALTPGNFLTLDGVTITVDAVNCEEGGACSGLWMVPNGPDASVIIEAATGGIGSTLTPIESYDCAGPFCVVPNYDLSVQLTAKTVGGAAELLGASIAISGEAPLGADVGGKETFAGITGNGCAAGLPVTLASPSASCTFAGSSSVQATKDLGISDFISGGAGTYQLTAITESFVRAPEPASMASLLSGVIALVAVRRLRRKV